MVVGVPGKKAWTRLSLTGLVFGVALLATISVLATVTTRRAVTTVEAADDVNTAWNSVFIDINQDVSALDDYLRLPDDMAVGLVDSRIGSADSRLTWLEQHAAPSEAVQLALVMDTYRSLTTKLRNLVTAARKNDDRGALATAVDAQATAVDMRRLVVIATAEQRNQLKSDMDQVDRDNRRLNIVWVLTVPFDAVLLLICAALLLGYQRRIERFAHNSQNQARHDPLTGLGNRMLLDEELSRAVETARSTGEPVALMMLDLDGFKGINDSLGHHAGDVLLQHIAARLPTGLRHTDVVGRLGGDEFAAVLPGIGSLDNALAVARHTLENIQHPVDLCGTTVDVSASIGVALFPTHCDCAEQLMQYADIAMYAAKRGHTGVALYSDSADRRSTRQLALLGEMRRAIDQRELVVHYQPKIDASTRAVIGAEALVRWQHPEHGLLQPGDFVPLVEQSELMSRFTEHIIGLALQQSHDWLVEGCEVPVAVNVGARCLLDRNFPAAVEHQLAVCGTPVSMLTLELTETSLINDPAQAKEMLTTLRALGLRLAIDDFGTGYSSMTYLITMPVQEIKIDRSFVSSMLSDASRRQVVQAIVNLGLSLGMEVVAEGVEDEETWDQLVAWQCSTGQGFHLGRPMPAAEFGRWLAGRAGATAQLPHVPARTGPLSS